MKVSLHNLFEPVAYTVLRGKNKQRENSKTCNRKDYEFYTNRVKHERFDHCVEKVYEKKSNDQFWWKQEKKHQEKRYQKQVEIFIKDNFFFSHGFKQVQKREEDQYGELNGMARVNWNEGMIEKHWRIIRERVVFECMVDRIQTSTKKNEAIPF